MRVLLVDDHIVVRQGMRQILLGMGDNVEVGEAADGHQALTLFREQEWDLVLLDIRLPGKSGVEVLKQIKQEQCQLPVLIFSTYPETQYAVRLIQAGAAGYLSKDADVEEILHAVRKAADGKSYVSSVVADLLVSAINSESIHSEDGVLPHEALSDREFQVFLELARGVRPRDIADKLNLSAKTIATHRSRILAKMGMTNNAELTLYANQHGILTL